MEEKKELLVIDSERSPNTITMEETRRLAVLFENFLKVSKAHTKINPIDLQNPENYIHLFSEIPGAIFASEESLDAFLEVVQFILNITIDKETHSGKQILEFCNVAIDFLQELDLLAFFFKVTTGLTKLIKG